MGSAQRARENTRRISTRVASSPFCKKGDRKQGGRHGRDEKGRTFSRVCTSGKGVCNAVESSGAKSQMEPTCRGVGETGGEERRGGKCCEGMLDRIKCTSVHTSARSRISYPFRRLSQQGRDSLQQSSVRKRIIGWGMILVSSRLHAGLSDCATLIRDFCPFWLVSSFFRVK